MKSSSLLSRRPGSSRAQFREHYETHHAQLGMRYFPFLKYVRNHLTRTSEDVDFDCISEFWQEDIALSLAIMTSPIGDVMREDERCFMDRGKTRPCEAHESVVFGAPRAVDPTPTRKRMILLECDPGIEPKVLVRDAAAWAIKSAAHTSAVTRISVDTAASFPGARSFPFAAIVSIWPATDCEIVPLDGGPPGALRFVELWVDSHESTPQQMAALYRRSELS